MNISISLASGMSNLIGLMALFVWSYELYFPDRTNTCPVHSVMNQKSSVLLLIPKLSWKTTLKILRGRICLLVCLHISGQVLWVNDEICRWRAVGHLALSRVKAMSRASDAEIQSMLVIYRTYIHTYIDLQMMTYFSDLFLGPDGSCGENEFLVADAD